MSAKDRNEYNQFIKGKGDKPHHSQHQQPLIPPPMMGMQMYMGMGAYGNMNPYGNMGNIGVPQQGYPPMNFPNKFQPQGEFRPEYGYPRPNNPQV